MVIVRDHSRHGRQRSTVLDPGFGQSRGSVVSGGIRLGGIGNVLKLARGRTVVVVIVRVQTTPRAVTDLSNGGLGVERLYWRVRR